MRTLGPLLEQQGYKLYYSSSNPNKWCRLMEMIYSVIRYFRKVEVVIIDTYSTQNFYYALLISQLCRLLGIPYIPILHGGNLTERLKMNPKLSTLIFKNAKINISPSQFLKKSFETYGYLNVKYIPNVIELSNYGFIKRDFPKPKLLWVRSFSSIYNPFLAIEVLKMIRGLGLDASLCMVGPDSDGSLGEVKKFAETLGVEVRFTGKVTKLDWIKISEDYNVFINTTNVDNTPVSIIEAMALGLPIVSTNVGGIPYLMQNKIHGLLVEKENVEAMVDAIVDLFKEEDNRQNMVLNARKLAETFDWERVKTQWNEILQN